MTPAGMRRDEHDKPNGFTCTCGFTFAGPGQFRNCEAYVNNAGESCVICPKCGKHYAAGCSEEEVEGAGDN